jgi:hypothetical protein
MSEGPGHQTWVIRNNVFRGVGDQCMIFGKDGNGSQGIQAIQVYNNTFVSAGGNNTIEFNLTSTGTVASNIFYNCAGYGGWGPFWIASTASVRHDYNLSGGSSPSQVGEAHSVSGNPMLVNPSGGDYHLSAGSPAINRSDNGALINPTRRSDVYGKPTVGIADIGAAEYQG